MAVVVTLSQRHNGQYIKCPQKVSALYSTYKVQLLQAIKPNDNYGNGSMKTLQYTTRTTVNTFCALTNKHFTRQWKYKIVTTLLKILHEKDKVDSEKLE